MTFDVVNAKVGYYGVKKDFTYPMIGNELYALFNDRLQSHFMHCMEIKKIGRLKITKVK